MGSGLVNSVVFEGISGSGKTTLFTPVHKMRLYADLHIHRFTASHWVYAKLNGRPVNVEELQQIETEFQKVTPTLVVWCWCKPADAEQRKRTQGDYNVERDFALAQDLFQEYFHDHSRWLNVLQVNTSVLSVDESVRLIAERLSAL